MANHEIFPDKPAFTPEPGRIVMVRYPNGEEWPAMIVKAYTDDRVMLSVHTSNDEQPVQLGWFDKRESKDGQGWYRPGDWPQPTLR